jgi:hypothetical protein
MNSQGRPESSGDDAVVQAVLMSVIAVALLALLWLLP